MSFPNLSKEIKKMIDLMIFHKYEKRFIEKHYPSFDYLDFYCTEDDIRGSWREFKSLCLLNGTLFSPKRIVSNKRRKIQYLSV